MIGKMPLVPSLRLVTVAEKQKVIPMVIVLKVIHMEQSHAIGVGQHIAATTSVDRKLLQHVRLMAKSFLHALIVVREMIQRRSPSSKPRDMRGFLIIKMVNGIKTV